MSFFKYHAFFCTNQRPDGQPCCNSLGGDKLRNYAKDRVKAVGLDQNNQVRINAAGCLGRCDQGPLMVVYPEGTWYTYVDQEDIDEIVDSHFGKGQVVERLKI